MFNKFKVVALGTILIELIRVNVISDKKISLCSTITADRKKHLGDSLSNIKLSADDKTSPMESSTCF